MKRRSFRGFMALMIAVSMVLLSACGSKPSTGSSGGQASPPGGQAGSSGQQPPKPAGPKPGGTLTIAKPSDATSLDPHAATAAPEVWVYANMYDTLVTLDRDMSFKPGLAESWKQVDQNTWRFTLRKGVKFHDGTPFNAGAVKFTFDRVLDPKKPARGKSWIGPIKEAKVVDDNTVDIITTAPYGALLSAASSVFVLGIVSPAAVEKWGADYGRHPSGTGPFKFEDWKSNDYISMVRNNDYWGEKPYLDKLIFKVVPEANARMLAFDNKEVDVVMQPPLAELAGLEGKKDVVVYKQPGLRTIHIGFNVHREPFTDPKVRQAFYHAVDRQSIVKFVLEGAASVAKGVIAPSVFGFYDAGIYDYNPDKAKQLLAEAGWKPGPNGKLQKDGKPLTISFWGYTGRDLKDREVAEAVQAQFEKIGVTVNLKIWEWGQFSQAIRYEAPKQPPNTAYDMYQLGWTTITGDADFGIYATFHSSTFPPNGTNATFYAPKEFDQALEAGQQALSADERKQHYKKAQELLYRDAPWIPLYHPTELAVMKGYIKGYQTHPAEYYMLRMEKTWLDK